MTNQDFERIYYPRYKDVISAIARKFAKGDADTFDDLVSAGTIGLLHALPERAGKNLDAFLRNIIRNKIVDHLRWLNRRDFERLDTFLMNNHDVIRDPDTGEMLLVHGDNLLTAVGPAECNSDGKLGPLYVNRRQRMKAIRQYDVDRPDGVTE